MSHDEVVALIPVREGSSRIEDKNFQAFAGHATLIHRKIDHLQTAGCFDHIYLSSDSDRARQIAEECGASFLYRDPEMCTDRPRWDEVVVAILETVPGNPHVAWTMVTSPLFYEYAEPVREYLSAFPERDSLVAVKEVREYLMDEAGRPLFSGYGPWHPYTPEIKPLYAIADTLFVARKSDQLRWRYWFGVKPLLYEVSAIEAIDINFPEDLKMARLAAAAQGAGEL